MFVLSVLAQALAMVGEHHDDGAVVEPQPPQVVKKSAHDRVARGDLAIVCEWITALVRLRRLVWRMRLVGVEEEEERVVLHALEPGHRQRCCLVSATLDASRRVCAARGHELVFVEIEAVANPARSSQNPRRDGPARGVSAILQQALKRRVGGRIKVIAQVVAHAVLEWQKPREDREVRGQGERDMAVGVLEQDRVFAQAIEMGRLDALVSICGKMIGAQGVNRDEHDRGLREPEPRLRARAAGHACQHENRQRAPLPRPEDVLHRVPPRRPDRRHLCRRRLHYAPDFVAALSLRPALSLATDFRGQRGRAGMPRPAEPDSTVLEQATCGSLGEETRGAIGAPRTKVEGRIPLSGGGRAWFGELCRGGYDHRKQAHGPCALST